MSIVDRVRSALAGELAHLARAGALGSLTADAAASAAFTVERPKRAEHGDYATNAAMVLAKLAGMPPRAIADLLVKALHSSDVFAAAEVAGPGFVNLRIKPAVLYDELDDVLRLGASYGRAAAAIGERIDIEFVSANPTGPLLVSHGRGAVYGDAIARLLEATGNRVVREYYINDFGNQVRLFAASVRAVATNAAVPEGGYQGDYVRDVAEQARALGALDKSDEELARMCVMLMMRGIKKTLADLGVAFDVWFSESSLHRVGRRWRRARSSRRRAAFSPKKTAPRSSSAKAIKKTRIASSKNRMETTRISRATSRTTRTRSRAATTGSSTSSAPITTATSRASRTRSKRSVFRRSRFEAPLFQLVFIYRNGELVKSSKRAGNIVTIDEVTEEIDDAAGRKGAGADALRFFYLSRSANTNVDFDIELAKKKSLDNPVFYVQYGHARLCSICASREGNRLRRSERARRWTSLAHGDELALVAEDCRIHADRRASAAEAREPHRVVFFVQELAREFQSYYTVHKNDPVLPPKSVREKPEWEKSWDIGEDERAARVDFRAADGLRVGARAPGHRGARADGTPGRCRRQDGR